MMEREGFFGYADEPWLPTLLDIERMKAEGTDEEKAYWQKFGWEVLDVPEADTHVKARMDILKTRFIANYGWRMLAYETMEQWQVRLQEKFDSVVDKYERAYTLYETNKTSMMEDVLPGIKTTATGKTTAGGSDTVTGKRKFSDTPDSSINDSDSFAGNISTDDGKTTYGRTDSTNTESKQVYTGSAIIDAVNETIDAWMDIDTAFIHSFENLFSNILWA